MTFRALGVVTLRPFTAENLALHSASRRALSPVADGHARLLPVLALALATTIAGAGFTGPASAQDAATKATAPSSAATAAPAAGRALSIPIVFARELRDLPPPLSLLDLPPPDDGIGGAKLAIADNNTTGRFVGQEFVLDVVQNEKPDALVAETVKKVDAGAGFVVVDAAPGTLLKLADALKDKPAVLFNAASPDDRLREEDCRANVKHTIPTRSMFADALAQYLTFKRWSRWFVIVGPAPEDKLLLEAYRRAAKRFGHKIVEERVYAYEPGSRRSDGGFEQIQQQMPSFTQDAKDHDVIVVVDEGGLFGEYVPYRSWTAKPVVGTAGLYPATWHPAIELWGGTQFQNRFKRLNGRNFRELDYNVWMAIRSVGEAATRRKSGDATSLIAYMASPEFELAAFKGQKLTYRTWNGQLRQPILLVTGKMHVTVSPQQGFLHQLTELDTLGVDRPETRCKALVN